MTGKGLFSPATAAPGAIGRGLHWAKRSIRTYSPGTSIVGRPGTLSQPHTSGVELVDMDR